MKHGHWNRKRSLLLSLQSAENKCIRKVWRVLWTKLLTTEQVYKMAETESELLSRIKSRKMWYFGHVMRILHDNIEARVMIGLVERVRNCRRRRISWIENMIMWTGRSSLEGVGRDMTWVTVCDQCSMLLVRWHEGHLACKNLALAMPEVLWGIGLGVTALWDKIVLLYEHLYCLD